MRARRNLVQVLFGGLAQLYSMPLTRQRPGSADRHRNALRAELTVDRDCVIEEETEAR